MEIRNESLKNKFSPVRFVYNWMMDALKRMEKHCPRKCFWTKEKETRTKIYLRVSANRLSNNWSQVVKQNLVFLELFLGLERERKIHPP